MHVQDSPTFYIWGLEPLNTHTSLIQHDFLENDRVQVELETMN